MKETTRRWLKRFPVGHYELHPDANMNFQMNRCAVLSGDLSTIDEMKKISSRIRNNADWIREFRALGDSTYAAGAKLKAAYYWRAAEFLMNADDPKRRELRERFVRIVRESYDISDSDIDRVPYPQAGPTAYLPSLRFGKGGSLGTIVTFGGFDSYFEEVISIVKSFAEEGYDVIHFEGPGQGEASEQGIPMTYRWETPVATILDYYGVKSATVIGLSLGGYLGLRAAAFEPRITRVVAWDIIYDFFQCSLRHLNPAAQAILRFARYRCSAPLINAALRSRMQKAPIVDWGVRQGMRVFGESTPYGFLNQILRMETQSFSKEIRADMLLLAGSEDHFVPLKMLHKQALALSNARSLTTRIFTDAESAQAHCQIGNLPLAVRVILDWLETTGHDAAA